MPALFYKRRFAACALRGYVYYELQLGPAWIKIIRPRHLGRRMLRMPVVLTGWDRGWRDPRDPRGA